MMNTKIERKIIFNIVTRDAAGIKISEFKRNFSKNVSNKDIKVWLFDHLVWAHCQDYTVDFEPILENELVD